MSQEQQTRTLGGPSLGQTESPVTPLYYVWDYNRVDRAFWAEHLEPWVPSRLIDAHTHVMHPRFRLTPMTEARRRQYWVAEVFEPIDAETAERCCQTVFPNREVKSVVMGFPDLDFDLDGGNAYLVEQCAQRGWWCLALVRPQWSQDKVAALLDQRSVIGIKPYYSLISLNPDTRDEHLEAGIFDFLPDHILEVVNDRQAWVTLHVPKAARLGHPDNIRDVHEVRRRYPRLRLVIAHLGRCYTEPHAREALPRLADDPGVYFDTAAVLNPVCHRIALECFGPKRVLYGTDNPILYLRGRRQYSGKTYLNRCSYPFYFNQNREAPEVEAQYTLGMYEDLRALKQACTELGLCGPADLAAIFHDNAAGLIQSALARKTGAPSADETFSPVP
jgi:predicted TIM-barrel fold metal-dependent hydrolase